MMNYFWITAKLKIKEMNNKQQFDDNSNYDNISKRVKI